MKIRELLKKRLRDKRGQIGIFLFILILFTILIIGFIASIVIGVIDFGSDTITPIMEDLGVVGDANLSHASEVTFGVIDNVVQSLSWLAGFAYLGALAFSFIFAMAYRSNPNPVFIGLYFMLMILLVFGCIVMSNVYENIYDEGAGNEISIRMQEQGILPYMIIYSPMIMVIVGFITGIFMFTGNKESLGGGYGV